MYFLSQRQSHTAKTQPCKLRCIKITLKKNEFTSFFVLHLQSLIFKFEFYFFELKFLPTRHSKKFIIFLPILSVVQQKVFLVC